MRSLIAIACLAAAIDARASTGSEPPDIYAVIIGYNGGRPGLPDLRYADDDAVRFSLFFAGMIPPGGSGRVWLLTDIDSDTQRSLARAGLAVAAHASPTRENVLNTLANVAKEFARQPGRPNRVLYVVYAGHGLQGRILLRPENVPEAAITGTELRSALAHIGVADPSMRTFLFVDACRSESLFAQRGAGASGEQDFAAGIAELEQRADSLKIGILTAAQSGKPAGEVRALEAGYFSHVLASGLSGAADADGDDVVTFGELAAFVAFNTQKLTGQLPWFEPPGGDLGASAIDHRGRNPHLVISGSEAGRYLIGSNAGLPVFVEAFKGPSRPLHLALPAGHYRVLRTSGEHTPRATEIDLRAGLALDLATAVWEDEAALPLLVRARGDSESAFSAPFSTEVVSTLAAGYHAGREPSVDASSVHHALALMGGVGPAPLHLGGPESSLAITYRWRQGPIFVAGLLRAATSRQATNGVNYDLRRMGALAESGFAWSPARRITLRVAAGLGLASTLRKNEQETHGDMWGPMVTLGAGLDVHLDRRWSVGGNFRYVAHWIKIDGNRERSIDPVLDLGVARWF